MYGESDVPEVAKTLLYARESDINDVDYTMPSELLLYEILPGLINPMTIPKNIEAQRKFNEQAGKLFKEIWRK